jgi:hypothetical protein
VTVSVLKTAEQSGLHCNKVLKCLLRPTSLEIFIFVTGEVPLPTVQKKKKLSHYRPGGALGVSEG